MSLKIKEILKEKGLTQKELAIQLDVSSVGLNKIINGNPTLETLKKIAKELNIDVKDLFYSSEEENMETIYIKEENKFKPIGKISINSK